MHSKTLIAIFIGISLGVIWLVQPFSDKPGKLVLDDRPKGGDFTMQTAQGDKSLADFKGKLVLIYFGYTYCPDVCPTNLGNISIAYRSLSKEKQEQVQVLFISVDPNRDTPQRLAQYAEYFEADMIGMTSSKDYINKIARNYGVVYAKVDDPNNGTNYAVDHSAFTYVVDQNGELKQQLPHSTSDEQFGNVFKSYLK